MSVLGVFTWIHQINKTIFGQFLLAAAVEGSQKSDGGSVKDVENGGAENNHERKVLSLNIFLLVSFINGFLVCISFQ